MGQRSCLLHCYATSQPGHSWCCPGQCQRTVAMNANIWPLTRHGETACDFEVITARTIQYFRYFFFRISASYSLITYASHTEQEICVIRQYIAFEKPIHYYHCTLYEERASRTSVLSALNLLSRFSFRFCMSCLDHKRNIWISPLSEEAQQVSHVPLH